MKDALGNIFSREALGTYGTAATAADAVREVLMVGALMDDYHFKHGDATRLSGLDDEYLANVIREGAARGIKFSPDLRIRVANLAYGTDFFTSAPKVSAQMVVFCYIFHMPAAAGYSPYPETMQSIHVRQPLAWHKALCATKAFYAANITSGFDEIPTREIANDPYSVIGSRLPINGLMHLDLLACCPP